MLLSYENFEPKADFILKSRLSSHEEMSLQLKNLDRDILKFFNMCLVTLTGGGTIFTAGNGGSAADAQHFAAELIGRYSRTRDPLSAICLNTDPSVITCISNDFGYSEIFSRQIMGLGKSSDLFVGFTTSGKSENVTKALKAAHEKNMKSAVLTGAHEGIEFLADLALRIPSVQTAAIQEGHTIILHIVSEMIEQFYLEKE
jgi:D-sedoheptulose 7-phosphate isomerase